MRLCSVFLKITKLQTLCFCIVQYKSKLPCLWLHSRENLLFWRVVSLHLDNYKSTELMSLKYPNLKLILLGKNCWHFVSLPLLWHAKVLLWKWPNKYSACMLTLVWELRWMRTFLWLNCRFDQKCWDISAQFI